MSFSRRAGVFASAFFFALPAFGVVNLVSNAAYAGTEKSKPQKIEPGVFDVPLKLSPSLEPKRKEIRQNFIFAQRNLRSFASKYGWTQLTDEPFMKQAEVYDSKDGYDQRLRELCPEVKKETPIPKTFTAGIEQDVFFSVTPEICNQVFKDGKEPDQFTKLITHELAHRLHVRIVHKDESKMGPMWFFEGFAVYVADQYRGNTPKLTESDIWSIVNSKDRGSYRAYKVVFTHFLQDTTLPQFMIEAGKPGFVAWLKEKEPVEIPKQ